MLTLIETKDKFLQATVQHIPRSILNTLSRHVWTSTTSRPQRTGPDCLGRYAKTSTVDRGTVKLTQSVRTHVVELSNLIAPTLNVRGAINLPVPIPSI